MGSLICDSSSLPAVLSKVKPDYFCIEANKLIYESILKTYEKFKKLDLILVKESLGEEGLAKCGGIGYLSSLVERLPKNPATGAYVSLVLDRHAQRRALEVSREIAELATSGASPDVLAKAGEKLKNLSGQTEDAGSLDDAGKLAITELDRVRTSGVDLSFGIQQLDEVLGGLRRKNLYVLGAKTSQGKTTTAINIGRHCVTHHKDAKVLYDVFENAEQIPTRFASQYFDIPLDWYLKPHTLSVADYGSVRDSLGQLNEFNDRFRIVQNAGLSRLRSLAARHKPDLIVVDYLQRWAHREDMGSTDRLSHAVGKAVSDLQDLAIEYNCAVICVSQLNRRAEDQRNRPPVIEDLKESGDIENYADVIILLYWPWRDTLSSKYQPNKYNFLVRKNKMGPCLDIASEINLKTLKISDWTAASLVSVQS